jgi:hypothetical protein
VKLRRGRKNLHALYLQRGDQPSDDDPFLGSMVDPEYAALVTESVRSDWHLNEMRLTAEAREADA